MEDRAVDTPLKYKWLDRICSSSGPSKSTTRHVLMALAKHMEADGSSCYPSTRTLAEETGLSRKAVETNLKKAASDGWIEITKHGASGQAWKRHSYFPLFPQKVESDVPHVDLEGGERASPRQGQRGEAHSPRSLEKVGKHVPHVSEKGGEPRSKGGEPDDQKVGNLVPLSTPVSTPETSPKEIQPSSQRPESGERQHWEDGGDELGRWLPLAKENIYYIHGGTERDAVIHGQRVGVGVEVNQYKRWVREHGRDPELVARAIRYLPEVTNLQPPVSLARWGDEDDGWAIYQQCEGLALREAEQAQPRDGFVVEIAERMAG